MTNKKPLLAVLASILLALTVTINYFLTEFISNWMSILIYVALSIVFIAQMIGLYKNKDSLYKCCVVIYIVAIVFMLIFGAIFWSGIYLQFYNEEGEIEAEKIAEVIGSKQGSKWIFILMAFLQVTFIPVSSAITTMVGVILFGAGYGFLYSLIGQLLGSVFAFYLGRILGERFVIWVIGKDAFNKYQEIVKGRDKIMLTFMFLFPMFPDDLLCMFAGLTTFTGVSFTIVVACTRSIAIGMTTLGVELIDLIMGLGVWSYVILALIVIFVIALFVLVWKQGDKLEYKLLSFIDRLLPKKFRKVFVSDKALQAFDATNERYASKKSKCDKIKENNDDTSKNEDISNNNSEK